MKSKLILTAHILFRALIVYPACGAIAGGIAGIFSFAPWSNNYDVSFAVEEGFPFGIMTGFFFGIIIVIPLLPFPLARTTLILFLATCLGSAIGTDASIFTWYLGMAGFWAAFGLIIMYGARREIITGADRKLLRVGKLI